METEVVFALGRALERLGIVAISGLTLWYGFRLFTIVTDADARARLEGQGFNLSFTRVGPGVFFALFGSVVLVYALKSPLDLPLSRGGGGDGQRVSYNLGSAQTSYKATISALNQLEMVANQVNAGELRPADREQLVDSVERLSAVRPLLVDAEFGGGTYAEYSMVRDTCSRDPAACDAYLRSRDKLQWFAEVDDFNERAN
jgi:hypothetical protein